MPPGYGSKPYPLSKGLSQYLFSQEPSKSEPLEFDKLTALEVYGRQQVDDDLKKVVRALWEPLELLPQMKHSTQFSVTIQTDRGIEELHWDLTIKKAHRDLHSVLHALRVLHHGWFHSNILLKHLQLILDADNEKDADINEEVKKIRELKDNLLKLNNFLDCVLLHYSGFTDNKLPSTLIEEIEHTTKQIYQVIKLLKSNALENVIPPNMITEEDVLCSVLGLHDDFAKRLKNLSEEMREHKTDIDYLQRFMGECQSHNVVNLHDTEAVQRGLQEMGFIENRSRVVAEWIAEQSFPEHRSLLQWAEIYIEHLFKYDIFLNNQVRKFPFDERCLNKWFLWNVEDECKGKSGADESQVSVINTTSKEKAIDFTEAKIAQFNESNPNGQLFYHGTDHKSVKNILECGIRLGNGKTKCDFSNGLGFYVADDFKYALEEHAMKSKFPALIMFNIGESYRRRCLDLSGPERRGDLKSVRDYFHSGGSRRRRPEQQLYQEVKNSHCIFGPVRRDGSSTRKWAGVMQICIRNEEFAEEVGSPSRIEGIIFLNTEDTR